MIIKGVTLELSGEELQKLAPLGGQIANLLGFPLPGVPEAPPAIAAAADPVRLTMPPAKEIRGTVEKMRGRPRKGTQLRTPGGPRLPPAKRAKAPPTRAEPRVVAALEPTARPSGFTPSKKVCAVCGEDYQPTGNAQKICVGCKAKRLQAIKDADRGAG